MKLKLKIKIKSKSFYQVKNEYVVEFEPLKPLKVAC